MQRTTLLISLSLLLVGGACRITVDPSDTTPPELRIYSHPEPSYSDGSPHADGEPLDLDRTAVIPAGTISDWPYLNAVAKDGESAISSVRITINASFMCDAFLEPTEPRTSWNTNVRLADENGEPDSPGSETSDTTNVLASLSVDRLWRAGRCYENEFNGETRTVERGTLHNVQGTYTATACNNSAGTREQQCTTKSGHFRLMEENNIEVTR